MFIIKDSISVSKLIDGLEYENSAIVTKRDMSTSIPGVFARGDCTGKPYQLAGRGRRQHRGTLGVRVR